MCENVDTESAYDDSHLCVITVPKSFLTMFYDMFLFYAI